MTTHNTHVDLILHADWIITVDTDNRVLNKHSLLVNNGEIQAILPQAKARTTYSANQVLELDGHALLPGLINSHTHSGMSLMRGIADDLPLMEWLESHIWPAEQRFMSAGLVHDGSRLAMAEMLRSGTTCFNDMYFYPDEVGRAASQVGMRVVLGLIVIDFPTIWAQDAQEYLRRGLQVHDEFRDNPLVHTAFAPHAPYTVSDVPLQKIMTYAEELDIPVHMHVHETVAEVNMALEQHGRRPLQRLQELGLLSPRLIAVHMTALLADEIRTLAECGAHVVHCPESNMKLASGICPVQALHDAGVNVALGTDGAASNNDLDMLGEMRSAALLGKVNDRDARSLNAHNVLRMATINGARALGIDDRVGSLEVGKQADLIAIDLDRIETRPLYEPCAQIVYAAGREQVRHVWVAGRQLLRDRQLLTLDEKDLLQNAMAWQQRIQQA